MDAARFEELLLERLSGICGQPVAADTPLFARGYLDSMRFVALLAFIETTLGRKVPTAQLSAEFFQTPRMIAAGFCP